MSLLAELITVLLALTVPGMGILTARFPQWPAELRFAAAPAVSIVILALAGIAGWIWPVAFPYLSPAVVATSVVLGLVLLVIRWGLIRSLDPVLPMAYAALVILATTTAMLPAHVPTSFEGPRFFTYLIKKDQLSTRIQALHHDLPIDNLVPHRFAMLCRRGADFRKLREPYSPPTMPAIAPNQHVGARTPLMALAGVHFSTIFGPAVPVDGNGGTVQDMEEDAYYRPILIAGIGMNAAFILPAYLIGRRLFGRLAGRLAVLLLSVNYGVLLHTNFIWPKALGGYFAAMLLFSLLTKRWSPWGSGLLTGLAYLSHPCAAATAAGVWIYRFVREEDRRACLKKTLAAGLIAAALVLPWYLWVRVWIGSPDNLIQQNIHANMEQGLRHAVEVRARNAICTLLPYAICLPIDTANAEWINAFFSVPGMLGLVFLPFYGAIFATPRGTLLAATTLLLPTLVAAAIIGAAVYCGVAPYGPFLYCPIGAAWGCGVLARWRTPWRALVMLCATLEQAGLFWLTYARHWDLIDFHRWSHVAKIAVVVLVQGAVIALAVRAAIQEEAQSPGLE